MLRLRATQNHAQQNSALRSVACEYDTPKKLHTVSPQVPKRL